MRKVIFTCILPLLLSLVCIYAIALNPEINNLLFSKIQYEEPFNQRQAYYENFSSYPGLEYQFLKSSDSAEIIYLLGSSELEKNSAAIPYNFISQHFTTQVKAIGHAGNQCLSIYAQLLANENRLKNTPLVIILSPGWFENKPAKGTSSALFLEFNSERSL